MKEETIELAIAMLTHLTKEGFGTGGALHRAAGGHIFRSAAALAALDMLGLIEVLPRPDLSLPWIWPRTYTITDAGRAYLQSFDELDLRAPYAAFRKMRPTQA